MKRPQTILAGAVFVLGLVLTNVVRAGLPDADALGATGAAAPVSVVQATADEAGLAPVSTTALPRMGTFWVMTTSPNGDLTRLPYPFLPPDLSALPIYSVSGNSFIVDDTRGQLLPSSARRMSGEQAASIAQMQAESMAALIGQIQFPTNSGGTNGFSPYSFTFSLDTNSLYLEITNVSRGNAYLNLHNASNSVYAIFEATNLATPFAGWRMAAEVFPTNASCQPFNVPAAEPTLFFRAEDWASVDDSAGTNFWLAFFFMEDDGYSSGLSLFISSASGASGTVAIPGLGITNAFSVAADGGTNISIPFQAMMSQFDLIETKGIRITASAPVTVYGLNSYPPGSAAFTAYPAPLLGTDYCVMARAALIDQPPFRSELAVVATADDTTVTITPSPTANLAGLSTPYATNLQQGETYEIHSADDMGDVTGTWITSDKPVAVFAGANAADVPDENTEAGNPLVQEQMPVEDWGTEALSMGFAGRTNGDSYRILAAYSNTVVGITGTVVTIMNEDSSPWLVSKTTETQVVTITNAGGFYDVIVEGPVEFQANQPIQVAHFANGSIFDNVSSEENPYEGDPCEILLPPTGHYLLTNIVVTLTNDPTDYYVNGDFDENFLNIIVPQSATNSTYMDGSLVAVTNYVAIGTSGYCGAQITITNSGKHKVTSSQPVGVEIYGWGEQDDYGYFGGIVK